MKTFKRILLIIAIIIAIPLVIALFTKSEYTVEREIVINRPKDEVFNYIKFLKNQNQYSRWAKMDPNMKTDFRGTDGTVGFVSAWKSEDKEVGQGEQEIKKINEGERVDYELRFIEPFPAISPAYMTTQSVSEKETKVVWGFNGKMTYPTNIMLLFMDMDEMIGNDLSTGLTNLKNILEQSSITKQ
jgi:hypothetical protein